MESLEAFIQKTALASEHEIKRFLFACIGSGLKLHKRVGFMFPLSCINYFLLINRFPLYIQRAVSKFAG